MFEYMTAQEAAEKWNVSLRWVQRLVKETVLRGYEVLTVCGLFRKMLKSLLMQEKS